MKQPPQWPWLLALLALLALVAARRMHHPEPTYGGRPLHQWLYEEAASTSYRTPDEVLSGAGDQLVPFLIEVLHVRDSSLASSLRSLLNRLPPSISGAIRQSPPADQLHATAAHWLRRLGPTAAPAVPALVSILDEPGGTPKAAATALGQIGPAAAPAVPDLIRVATATNGSNGSFWAGRAILQIGVYRSNDVARLIAHPDPEIRLAGEVGVRLLASDTNGAIKLLADALTVEPMRLDAYWLLRDFGPRAAPVRLQLAALLRDTNSLIRVVGAGLLTSIGPEAVSAVPDLIDAVSHENDFFSRRAMIRALGAIGPGASNAIPTLEGLLHGDDEETIKAAREALEKIRGR